LGQFTQVRKAYIVSFQ